MKMKNGPSIAAWETRLYTVPRHTLATVVIPSKTVPAKQPYNSDGTGNEINYGALLSNLKKFNPPKAQKYPKHWNKRVLV